MEGFDFGDAAFSTRSFTETVFKRGTYDAESLLKPTGYAVWKWESAAGRWVMLSDRSSPGHEPGEGPTGPGRFEGQVVRWACTASPSPP